jgi:hypothetical protein
MTSMVWLIASTPPSAAHTTSSDSCAVSLALFSTCWIEPSISFIAEEVSSAVELRASMFLATSLTEKVISSIEVAVSCTLAARFNMLSATSSLAAAISRMLLALSSALEASSSTLSAMPLRPPLTEVSACEVSSIACAEEVKPSLSSCSRAVASSSRPPLGRPRSIIAAAGPRRAWRRRAGW